MKKIAKIIKNVNKKQNFSRAEKKLEHPQKNSSSLSLTKRTSAHKKIKK